MIFDEEVYLYGRCHIFALVLSKRCGYPIEFCWDEETVVNEATGNYIPVLVHAYCVLPNGMCVDARGMVSRKEMFNDYDWSVRGYTQETLKSIEEQMRLSELDKPEEGEIERLQQHIETFLELYRVAST